jgi:hypothetical protein
MKKLLVGLLALGSLSTFASVECINSLAQLSEYSDSIGQSKAYIHRNNTEAQKYTAYLRILNENQNLDKVMGYSREELIQLANESLSANMPLHESLNKSPEMLSTLMNNAQESCK